MAKKKSTKKAKPATQPESITVAYDLFDLPTAQHKAGLAGLVLQIVSMTERKLPTEQIPVIEQLTPTSAVVRFTELSAQGLFDDAYAASWEESEPREKPRKKRDKSTIPPHKTVSVKRLDKKTGKAIEVPGYVYLDVTPKLPCLEQHLPHKGGWLKLWREMIYAVPREKPTTWKPYEVRANRQPYKEGKKTVWEKLVTVDRERARNQFDLSEVEAGLLLGGQKESAEQVPIHGRTEHNFLLHFWPLTVLVFVPQTLENDGSVKSVGYTLAIPEVADLKEFCRVYPRMLSQLSTDARGFRPTAAVIDIPQQAGLEFLENLARLAERTAKKTEIGDVVSSIEYLHLVKAGNNVKSMAAGRITPNPRLLDRYLAIVGGRRPRFRNPLFRAGLMRWMLDEADVPGQSTWYRPMARMMAERPWPLFLRCAKTPKAIPWFAADAVTQFQDTLQEYHDELEDSSMTDVQQPLAAADKPKPPLEVLVYRLVQNFVRQKTSGKCGLKWDDFKDKKIKDEKTKKERVDVPQEYADARERVVSDAFLAMRSRREKDFVEYFTASICSVRRYLSEDDFCVVAKALLDQSEDVKTLTLLALSANS